jgi:hypothetical protein|tara:strand:- start:205 stop:630 length:426 start_codon:yes stop_codon:yes gene_type:complete
MLYLDRERTLYAGLPFAKTLHRLPSNETIVVEEYSKLQIKSANRWFNVISGGTIASLNIELFGMFTGYSLLSPLVCCGSIFLHTFGSIFTFMALTDGWWYPYLTFTMVLLAIFPALIEVTVIVKECLCNLKVLKFIEVKLS